MIRGLGRAAVQTIFIFAATIVAGEAAQASGFEKTVLWSGRYSGAAGVTAPNIAGSEALAFNPAGILGVAKTHEVTANLALVQSQFKGPIGADNVQSTGQTTIVSPFALIYAMKMNDDFALAAGAYTAGGAKAEYNDVPFPLSATANNARLATVKTSLAVTEFSLGAAYRPMEKLRVGASWRAAMASANFASVALPSNNNSAVANVEFSNLKDTQWFGYRLGMQWTEENWGVGLAYRSEFKFKASGDAAGALGTPTTTFPITSNGATLTTSLPIQLALGGYYDLDPKVWRVLLQYDFTNYAKIDQIPIEGQYTSAATGTRNFDALRMDWSDQHAVRLGAEYGGAVVPIRFGYAWTSRVTSNDYARAAFVPPGAAHTLTLGSGMDFMESALRADAGVDYTFSSGSGNSNSTDVSSRRGDYAVNAVSLHMGVGYSF